MLLKCITLQWMKYYLKLSFEFIKYKQCFKLRQLCRTYLNNEIFGSLLIDVYWTLRFRVEFYWSEFIFEVYQFHRERQTLTHIYIQTYTLTLSLSISHPRTHSSLTHKCAHILHLQTHTHTTDFVIPKYGGTEKYLWSPG